MQRAKVGRLVPGGNKIGGGPNACYTVCMSIEPLIERLQSRIVVARDLDDELARKKALLNALTDEIRTLRAELTKAGVTVVRTKRDEPVSVKWRSILAAVKAQSLDSFDHNDISAIAERIGYQVKRSTAHSQMKDYAEKGFIKRLPDGRYRHR